MEIAAAFVLSIVGGWAFAFRWRFTRYATLRADGQHLYFRAAIFGVALFAFALILQIILITRFPAYEEFDRLLAGFITPILKEGGNTRQGELVVTAAMSVVLGPILAEILNRVTPRVWAIRKAMNFQEQLLLDAQQLEMPVQITLRTNKVYVGIVRKIPDPARPPPVLALFPMYSGYRDDTGRVVLTTDYEPLYEALRSKSVEGQIGLPKDWELSFELPLGLADIISVSMFIPKIYKHMNPNWRDSIGPRAGTPPPQQLVVELRRRRPVEQSGEEG